MRDSYRVMLVDDEPHILKALRRLLTVTPCVYNGVTYRLQLELHESPVAALEAARHMAFDLFVVDYRMPLMDGVQFLKSVREIQPQAGRLILSGYADLNALIGAINEAQIYRFLSKPWNDYELVSAIAQALAYRALLLDTEHLADEARLARHRVTAEELELKRLEEEEPGITRVNWGPDGSVLLDEDLLP